MLSINEFTRIVQRFRGDDPLPTQPTPPDFLDVEDWFRAYRRAPFGIDYGLGDNRPTGYREKWRQVLAWGLHEALGATDGHISDVGLSELDNVAADGPVVIVVCSATLPTVSSWKAAKTTWSRLRHPRKVYLRVCKSWPKSVSIPDPVPDKKASDGSFWAVLKDRNDEAGMGSWTGLLRRDAAEVWARTGWGERCCIEDQLVILSEAGLMSRIAATMILSQISKDMRPEARAALTPWAADSLSVFSSAMDSVGSDPAGERCDHAAVTTRQAFLAVEEHVKAGNPERALAELTGMARIWTAMSDPDRLMLLQGLDGMIRGSNRDRLASGALLLVERLLTQSSDASQQITGRLHDLSYYAKLYLESASRNHSR